LAASLERLCATLDKNSNFGARVDEWFLNLFPRPKPFLYNGGGYLTSSLSPTLGTMIFGLIAGRWLRLERTNSEKSSDARQGGIDLPRSGRGAPFHRHLPNCETDLDAKLDYL